ncbi:MAG: MBL fold metallo-hydrolase [Rickettsiales bacterium]
MKITVLGCGHSFGVPVIGCDCPVCNSDNPKNTRLRASIFIEINGVNIVVDTSPDFRQQMLSNNIKKIDAVLYTHDHADHTHGVDDLRQFNALQGEAIPIYADAYTIDSLKSKIPYAFLPKPTTSDVLFRPTLTPHTLPDLPVHEFEVKGVKITVFQQKHGKFTSFGYRIGNFAYSTDVNVLPESAFEALAGVDYWLVDCLRYTPSYSHSNLENTLKWIERVKPKHAILTHLAHEFDYDILSSEVPSGIVVAYDGMVINV